MPLRTFEADEVSSPSTGVVRALDALVGTTIGSGTYTIDGILGQGGMGTVYSAVHNWTGRAVAIKVLRRELTDDLDVTRVLQEARAATSVAHPNVVEVLDMGRDPDGRVYLVFERLDGETLADALDRGAVLGPDEIAETLLPVLDALAVAHDLGIVHRDIKPENIFLAREGTTVKPKLLDFGLAKMRHAEGHRTQTGVISGTPAYMSPERAIGKRETGPEADVWSMGVVLYECLTNRLPFHSDHSMGVLLAVVNDPVPTLRGDPKVPPALAAVVDATLVRDVSARVPNAAALRDMLADAVGAPFVVRSSGADAPASSRVTHFGHAVPEVPRISRDERETEPSIPSSDLLRPVIAPRMPSRRTMAAVVAVFLLASTLALIYRFTRPEAVAPVTPATAAAVVTSAPPAVVSAPVPATQVAPVSAPAPEVETPAPRATARRGTSTTSRMSTTRVRPSRGTRGVLILD